MLAVDNAFWVPEAILRALLELPLFPTVLEGVEEAIEGLLDTRTASLTLEIVI